MGPHSGFTRAFLMLLAVIAVSSTAQALALHNLKDQHLEAIYGTYATGGDCQHEPQVIVDASGFTFRSRQRDTHVATFVFGISYYSGAHGQPSQEDANKYAFFPFPANVTEGQWGPETSDYGPLTMEIDGKQHTLTIEAGRDALLTPLQTALVRGSPYALCGMQAAAATLKRREAAEVAVDRARAERLSYPMHMNFIYNVIGPTPQQVAAVKRSAGVDLAHCPYADKRCYRITLADLDYDGRPDLLVRYDQATGQCDVSGCPGIIVMAVPRGYAPRRLDNLQKFHNVVDVLASKHHGMHDLQYDGRGAVWTWDGSHYMSGHAAADTNEPITQPDAHAAGWETRVAANHTLAMVVARDSVIKSLSVFCDQGKPVLAMLVKARPPAGAVMLTFGFRSYPVVVPMGQGNHEGTLWLSDLSRSDLPVWFAHRGSDTEKQAFARPDTEASLQINGSDQGRISLLNSTAATHAALSSCYRY